MSANDLYGPIREVVITCPVHQRCIGDLLEEAYALLLAENLPRCTCLGCVPHEIRLRAWHLYWARSPSTI